MTGSDAPFAADPSQHPKVVNLAIEHHPYRPVFIRHRLLATGQINDRQPAVRQSNARGTPNPFGIGTAVANGVGHRRQRIDADRPFTI
ncbi:MAG: hypothetical protein VB876_10955 [Pirellulales bacterium]